MHTAKKIFRADNDGEIHADLPVGQPGREVELLLVWNDPEEPAPQGELADLVGLLKDTPIERPHRSFPQVDGTMEDHAGQPDTAVCGRAQGMSSRQTWLGSAL